MSRNDRGVRRQQRQSRAEGRLIAVRSSGLQADLRPGDRVRWAGGHQGRVIEVRPDQAVDIAETAVQGRLWRLRALDVERY